MGEKPGFKALNIFFPSGKGMQVEEEAVEEEAGEEQDEKQQSEEDTDEEEEKMRG